MKTFKEYFNQNVLIESVSEAEALKYKSATDFEDGINVHPKTLTSDEMTNFIVDYGLKALKIL